MAAKRPVHYGVGFGREAAKLSIFELDFGREAATCPFWHVFGRAAANLSIFEVDFGREEVTCPFLTCFWPRAANLSISSTFFEDMSNMFFLKTFKKNFTPEVSEACKGAFEYLKLFHIHINVFSAP